MSPNKRARSASDSDIDNKPEQSSRGRNTRIKSEPDISPVAPITSGEAEEKVEGQSSQGDEDSERRSSSELKTASNVAPTDATGAASRAGTAAIQQPTVTPQSNEGGPVIAGNDNERALIRRPESRTNERTDTTQPRPTDPFHDHQQPIQDQRPVHHAQGIVRFLPVVWLPTLKFFVLGENAPLMWLPNFVCSSDLAARNAIVMEMRRRVALHNRRTMLKVLYFNGQRIDHGELLPGPLAGRCETILAEVRQMRIADP